MRCHLWNLLLALAVWVDVTLGFTPLTSKVARTRQTSSTFRTLSAEKEETPSSSSSSGVVELGDDDDTNDKQGETAKSDSLPKAVSGPLFISQGEVDPDTLNPDFSDAKQTRVIIYTILSLLPVLFLIPFMLGRDFIPVDQLPPVELN